MLPRGNRLKKKKEIERVFREGKGCREDFLFLKLIKNNLKASRFAFVVSQKVAKKATLRNKIKRRLRTIFRIRLPEIKTGFDGVVVVQKGGENKSFQTLSQVADKLLKKTKLL